MSTLEERARELAYAWYDGEPYGLRLKLVEGLALKITALLTQIQAEARLSEQAEHTPECWHFNNVSAKEWIDEYFKLRDKRIAELRAQAAAPATKEG